MIPPDLRFWYSFKLVRTVDGDTADMDWDLGAGVLLPNVRFRFFGINTPEKKQLTKVAGQNAQAYVTRLLQDASDKGVLLGQTVKAKAGGSKKDDFGRYLVNLWAPVSFPSDTEGVKQGPPHEVEESHAYHRAARIDTLDGEWTCLNTLLVLAGHAVEYYP